MSVVLFAACTGTWQVQAKLHGTPVELASIGCPTQLTMMHADESPWTLVSVYVVAALLAVQVGVGIAALGASRRVRCVIVSLCVVVGVCVSPCVSLCVSLCAAD